MSADRPSAPATGLADLLDGSSDDARCALERVLADLDLAPRAFDGTGPQRWVEADASAAGEERVRRAACELADDAWLFVHVRAASGAAPDERELARWRDVVWPDVHVGRVYRLDGAGVTRETLQGRHALVPPSAGARGAVLAGQRTAHVLSPDATVEKFDANAGGWNGVPGSPGWPHHRWMRAHVARFARRSSATRILDFGCGAGWVGIEAALSAGRPPLCAFDPSPAMVRQAEANARAAGLVDFTGRTGFGEDPPFARDGEQRFDLVLSSGVISFSPDAERWLDGLTRTVAPGGTLVVGDLHAGSRGMRARRRRRPLLPVRELNAKRPGDVRAGLERRGFRYVAGAGYQLTWPIPEAMHVNETRLSGALTHPLLWLNRCAAALDGLAGSALARNFDSWVMRLEAPR